MTSTAVKDVNSLVTAMSSMAANAGNATGSLTGNFGDVMSKASGDAMKQNDVSGKTQLDTSKRPDTGKQVSNAEKTANTQEPAKQTDDVQTTDTKNVDKTDIQKTNEQDAVTKPELDQKAEKQLEEAGEELVDAIADKLGITSEEVKAAMEAMGMSLYSLFNPQELTMLTVQLSGENDSMALLTNENLFADVQDLVQMADATLQSLADELGMNVQELTAAIQDAQVSATENPEGELPVLTPNGEKTGNLTNAQAAETQSYTVTVEENGKTVEVSVTTDAKGNVENTQATAQETVNPQEGQEENKGNKQNAHTGEEASNQAEGFTPETLMKNSQAVTNESFVDTTTFAATNTQDIMNQIMEYMKIQLKPDMNQLEMQLHPASLGTIHIQIASKEGVITAQFTTQNEAVKSAIEGQLADLKESLKEQGVKVEAVEVSVESHFFESSLWQGQGNGEDAYEGRKKGTRKINLNDLNLDDLSELDEEETITRQMMEANGNSVDYTA